MTTLRRSRFGGLSGAKIYIATTDDVFKKQYFSFAIEINPIKAITTNSSFPK